ncbi:hypothetical protein DFH07DRAFT_772787 [Mycena maculata]|uniref:Uncharacterized protein n=1 Tax=Mycena maculata TaxID=230809 RepID=A0AAD7J6I4_9AGAR|nr:hypothetical protein DFH07DRAFT_772787 [Mycena maculata]
MMADMMADIHRIEARGTHQKMLRHSLLGIRKNLIFFFEFGQRITLFGTLSWEIAIWGSANRMGTPWIEGCTDIPERETLEAKARRDMSEQECLDVKACRLIAAAPEPQANLPTSPRLPLCTAHQTQRAGRRAGSEHCHAYGATSSSLSLGHTTDPKLAAVSLSQHQPRAPAGVPHAAASSHVPSSAGQDKTLRSVGEVAIAVAVSPATFACVVPVPKRNTCCNTCADASAHVPHPNICAPSRALKGLEANPRTSSSALECPQANPYTQIPTLQAVHSNALK